MCTVLPSGLLQPVPERLSHGGLSSARLNQVHNLVQVPLARSVGEGQKGNECKVRPASFQRKLRREEGRMVEVEGTLWFYKYE